MNQRRTDLVLLYRGGFSSSDRGVAYPVVLRNRGVGTFWDVELRVLHQGEETDRNVVRQIGPQTESGQIFLLIPARYCDGGSPGVGLRPRGRAHAEALLDGEVVAVVELPGSAEAPTVERVPRSADEIESLIRGRQPGWEYLLFGAVLLREMNALESKYRDHEIGFAAPQPGSVLEAGEATDALRSAINEARSLVANVDRIFDATAQERAFGRPGEAGDPERIEHLASRVIAIYAGLLDWSARALGLPVEDEFRQVRDMVSRFVELPITQFREFVDKAVADLDRLPEQLGAEDDTAPVILNLTLKLEMDESLLQEYERELRRLERLYGVDD